jgi:hypothetical protein
VARGAAAGRSPDGARGGEEGRSPDGARGGEEGRSLVVARGANLRAALPCLAGESDPGADLPTGAVATLHVHPGGSPVARLVSWPGAASG